MNDLKNKLIREISESSDRNLIFKIWEFMKSEKYSTAVYESETTYDSKQPMTDEQVEEYFRKEKMELPSGILEILKIGEKQIESGQYYSNDEVEKYFEEWLKD